MIDKFGRRTPTASGKVQLIELKTGKLLTTVGDDFDVVLAADQSLVATVGPEKLVRIYRVADGALVWSMKRHADFITSLEFSPDGKHLASADRAGGIFINEATTGKNPRLLADSSDAVSQLAWRSDARSLAAFTSTQNAFVGDWTGTVREWSQEGREVRAFIHID